MTPRSIIISRTDSIGDVVLTLPVAAALRQRYPDAEILFLGRKYTEAVISVSKHVDRFINWDEIGALPADKGAETLRAYGADMIIHVFPRKEIAFLAKKAGIQYRMGTTGRWYHWVTCNRLVRLSRRNSGLHEAQLNLRLVRSINDGRLYTTDEVGQMFGMTRLPALDESLSSLLTKDKFNLIIHPRSKGSAREWGFENFHKLVGSLSGDRFSIFITGTEEEGREIRKSGLASMAGVTDLSGRLSLGELIAFIAASDGLVAASTGPLHLAAAMGKIAIGIYPPIRPMHPGRWAPLGTSGAGRVLVRVHVRAGKV